MALSLERELSPFFTAFLLPVFTELVISLKNFSKPELTNIACPFAYVVAVNHVYFHSFGSFLWSSVSRFQAARFWCGRMLLACMRQ